MTKIATASTLLFVLFLWTGCNVFEAFDAPGSSDDLDDLVHDADIFLQRGHADEAVSLLRRAQDLYPASNRVKIKLSTALLQQHDIGLTDVLRITRALNGDQPSPDLTASSFASLQAPESAASATADGGPDAGSEALICSFPATHTRDEFDPRVIPRFEDFQPGTEALEEIRGLIKRVLDDEETEIGDFDQSVAIDAVIESLREEGLSDEEISEGMINDAVAHMTLAYLDITQEARESYSFYYVTAPDEYQYLGYCAPTQQKFDEAQQTAACRLGDISYVNDLLVKRSEVLDTEQDSIAEEVAKYAADAYEVLERELDATCSE